MIAKNVTGQAKPRGNRSDFFGVKAAPSRYLVPDSVVYTLRTWEYVSGWMSWCRRLLEGLFPLCSFGGGVIN